MSKPPSRIVDIGPIEQIPLRGARLVKTAHGCIAVFRTGENEAFALDDKCPHKDGPLSQGIVHGKFVTCPLHNWVISLETGAAQGADAGATRTYTLIIKDGHMLLELPQVAKTTAAA
jgi:nitrite reductase (NADH) small subunit